MNSHDCPHDARSPPGQPFEVQVGHARVHVTASGILDAVRQARTRLCQEMPWLWDLIQALEDHKFCVRASRHHHG